MEEGEVGWKTGGSRRNRKRMKVRRNGKRMNRGAIGRGWKLGGMRMKQEEMERG